MRISFLGQVAQFDQNAAGGHILLERKASPEAVFINLDSRGVLLTQHGLKIVSEAFLFWQDVLWRNTVCYVIHCKGNIYYALHTVTSHNYIYAKVCQYNTGHSDLSVSALKTLWHMKQGLRLWNNMIQNWQTSNVCKWATEDLSDLLRKAKTKARLMMDCVTKFLLRNGPKNAQHDKSEDIMIWNAALVKTRMSLGAGCRVRVCFHLCISADRKSKAPALPGNETCWCQCGQRTACTLLPARVNHQTTATTRAAKPVNNTSVARWRAQAFGSLCWALGLNLK